MDREQSTQVWVMIMMRNGKKEENWICIYETMVQVGAGIDNNNKLNERLKIKAWMDG